VRARFFGTCPFALALACAGCVAGEEPGDESGTGAGSTGAGEPAARVVGQVDVIDLCGVDGAHVVSFRATKVGCEQGPPAPCTIRTDPYEEIVGDAATCPAANNSLDMAVVIEAPGRYQIEARALTDNGYVGRCFGQDGGTEALVTSEQIAARATVSVSSRAGPCPSP
jgi:hypothetical protein